MAEYAWRGWDFSEIYCSFYRSYTEIYRYFQYFNSKIVRSKNNKDRECQKATDALHNLQHKKVFETNWHTAPLPILSCAGGFFVTFAGSMKIANAVWSVKIFTTWRKVLNAEA